MEEWALWEDKYSAEVRERSVRLVLFRGEFDNNNWNRFDVAPDGERFLMVQPQPESIPDRLRVVHGWSVE